MTEERIAQLDAIGFEWTPPKVRKSTGSATAARDVQFDSKPAAVSFETDAVVLAPSPGQHQGYFEDSIDAMAESCNTTSVQQPFTADDDAEDAQPTKNERAPIKKRAPREKKAPRGDFGDKEKKRKIWNERFEELKAYKEQHGNCDVPGRCKEHPQLGRW
jgi:hypothetical protein